MEEFTLVNNYRIPNISTIENLEMYLGVGYGHVIQFGQYAIATDVSYRGNYFAAIYEMVETPEETGLSAIECRIQLIKTAKETFEDAGHAIQWGLKNCK